MDTDIYRAARLAYRLGRQDQQRILEVRLRKHFDSDVQSKQLRELAEGMTDELVDFHAIVRAAEKDSTPVNSPETADAGDGLFNGLAYRETLTHASGMADQLGDGSWAKWLQEQADEVAATLDEMRGHLEAKHAHDPKADK